VFGVPRYKEMLYCNQMIMFYCNEAEVNDNFFIFCIFKPDKKNSSCLRLCLQPGSRFLQPAMGNGIRMSGV